jgi:hypothetical protein
MSLQRSLLDAIEHTQAIEHAFLAGLPEAERRAAGASTDWSAKDLLAHLVDWRMRAAEDMKLVAEGQTPPEITEFDPVNEMVFERHKDRTWGDVRGMSRAAWRDLASALRGLSDERLAAPSDLPSMNGRPWWRHALIEVASHPVQHLAGWAAAHGRSDEATRWQEDNASRLEALDPDPAWGGVVRYNLACYYALSGASANAIASLAAALRLNPGLTDWSRKDEDLDSLRGNPEYKALYAGRD